MPVHHAEAYGELVGLERELAQQVLISVRARCFRSYASKRHEKDVPARATMGILLARYF